jgi:hypothetical protein
MFLNTECFKFGGKHDGKIFPLFFIAVDFYN